MSVPLLLMRYPVTAILSVDAVHVRLICELEIAVADSPVGTDGGIRSLTTVTPIGVAPLAAVNIWSGIRTHKPATVAKTRCKIFFG
jgi:hypothetical protein